MKHDKTLEMRLIDILHSTRTRKLAIVFVLAGIVICIVSLLPPVQNVIISFTNTHISRFNESGAFGTRLLSLLSLALFGLIIFTLSLCCLFARNIAVFMEDAKNSILILSFATVIIVFILSFISIFSYRHGWQWLTSDHSSEMVLGKLLSEENAFVSPNWHYSTELRLIYQTLFTMPLFKLLGGGNWALIRSLNILLNNIVLLYAYLFMMKQLKINTKWICITSLFLILPLSADYWDIVTFGGYYIFFIAQIFCCLGLFIALAGHAASKKIPFIAFILFTALSFVLGVQGIRSLLSVHIPLLITCIYFYSIKGQKKIFPLFLGCYSFIICCIGFAANNLLHFKYSFHQFVTMRLEDLYRNFLPKLGQSLVSLANFFGLSAGSSFLSAQGALSVVAIIGTIILFWAVFKHFFHKEHLSENQGNRIKNIPSKNQFIPIFFGVSVIFNVFIFIIINQQIVQRYFIPSLVLYVPLAALLFEYAEKTYGYLKRIAIISGIMLFIFGQAYLTFQDMKKVDVNSTREGYIQYILDNNLDYGFATFWNANVTTELSNGRIELAGLEPDGLKPGDVQFHMWEWQNPKKFYTCAVGNFS